MKSNRGVEFSTTDPEVIHALELFTERLLSMSQGAEAILETAKVQPEEPSLQLACAMFYLFGQTPGAQTEAEAYLNQAGRQTRKFNPRENAFYRALHLWHDKSFDAAVSAFESITEQFPEDLLALRAAEFIYYVLGQQHSGQRFLSHTGRLFERHRSDTDFLAMHAFANELSGDLFGARSAAETALGLREVNPWAQHALEHVLLWEGSHENAISQMEAWLGEWGSVARPIQCHNAWHLALTRVDRLEFEQAFEVFDAHVWGRTPDLVVEQLDSIAFLWRAEMAGATFDQARWKQIAEHISPVCEDLFMPFATAHYAYALGKAGAKDALDALLRRVEQRAHEPDAEARRVWAPVGRAIIHAVAALSLEKSAEACEILEPVMPDMPTIGGSDAQDDLFRFAYLHALKQSGQRANAKAYLRERLDRKSASPLEQQLLGVLS